MWQSLLLATALILSGSGDRKIDTARFELWFGATPTSPIGPPVPCLNPTPDHMLCPSYEADYVPDYETIVPRAIQSCGASFVSFHPMTEGKMGAYFDVDRTRSSEIVNCIKQRLPQGSVHEG